MQRSGLPQAIKTVSRNRASDCVYARMLTTRYPVYFTRNRYAQNSEPADKSAAGSSVNANQVTPFRHCALLNGSIFRLLTHYPPF